MGSLPVTTDETTKELPVVGGQLDSHPYGEDLSDDQDQGPINHVANSQHGTILAAWVPMGERSVQRRVNYRIANMFHPSPID